MLLILTSTFTWYCINNYEIDNKHNKEADHLSGDLTADSNSNIDDHEAQHKRIGRKNMFNTLSENELQSSPQLED